MPVQMEELMIEDVVKFDNTQFRHPLTVSEVYSLGITIKQVIIDTFETLQNVCYDDTGLSMLEKIINYEKEEKDLFIKYLKFSRNAEIGLFYESGGLHLSTPVTLDDIGNSAPLIERNIDNFYRRINKIKNDVIYNITTVKGQRYTYSVKNEKDVFLLCISARDNASELFRRLAKLYPNSELKYAFEEMAVIIEEGSLTLSNLHTVA